MYPRGIPRCQHNVYTVFAMHISLRLLNIMQMSKQRERYATYQLPCVLKISYRYIIKTQKNDYFPQNRNRNKAFSLKTFQLSTIIFFPTDNYVFVPV